MLRFGSALVSRQTLAPALVAGRARALSTTALVRSDGPFSRPGPPPLPAEEQREFERLVRERQNQLPFTSNTEEGKENLHPDARKGAGADFDGDTNPETGEVGGPKKNPLSWQAEWAYGGRTTDF